VLAYSNDAEDGSKYTGAYLKLLLTDKIYSCLLTVMLQFMNNIHMCLSTVMTHYTDEVHRCQAGIQVLTYSNDAVDR